VLQGNALIQGLAVIIYRTTLCGTSSLCFVLTPPAWFDRPWAPSPTMPLLLLLLQVSHDQYLIESTVDELWMCEGGKVTPFHGTFEEYKKRLRSKAH
jgi:hypothetical protein